MFSWLTQTNKVKFLSYLDYQLGKVSLWFIYDGWLSISSEFCNHLLQEIFLQRELEFFSSHWPQYIFHFCGLLRTDRQVKKNISLKKIARWLLLFLSQVKNSLPKLSRHQLLVCLKLVLQPLYFRTDPLFIKYNYLLFIINQNNSFKIIF
jgi:hypothetical protein